LGSLQIKITNYDKALAIDPHFVLALNGKDWALYKLRLQITIELTQQAKAIQQAIGCSNIGGMLGQTSSSLLPLPMP